MPFLIFQEETDLVVSGLLDIRGEWSVDQGERMALVEDEADELPLVCSAIDVLQLGEAEQSLINAYSV